MPKLLPSCAEATRRISLAEDGTLPFQSRAGLYLHLAVCTFCRRYHRQIRFLRSALKEHRDEFGSVSKQGLSEPARQRMIQSLSDSA